MILPRPQYEVPTESIADLLSEPDPTAFGGELVEPKALVAEPDARIPRVETSAPAVRQGSLFAAVSHDEALVEEAIALVVNHRRANAAFLRNRLRIRFDDAIDLLRVLAERGVVALDESGAQGRVLVDR